ncbi:MAG: hypothetical protein AAF138_01910, partial [Planctomycetota bacterium]
MNSFRRVTLAALAITAPIATAEDANPLSDAPVYFEMFVWTDTNLTSADGRFSTYPIIDPIQIPFGGTAVVPGAAFGVRSFELSSSCITVDGVRTITLEMKVFNPGGCLRVFDDNSVYSGFLLAGSQDARWGYTYVIGINAADPQQLSRGERTGFARRESVNSCLFAGNSTQNGPGDFEPGTSLQVGPQSVARSTRSPGGPFSNGSEGNTIAITWQYEYTVSRPACG